MALLHLPVGRILSHRCLSLRLDKSWLAALMTGIAVLGDNSVTAAEDTLFLLLVEEFGLV